ncbi:MAG: beta-L-arabinofuranosidase domain-containing protein [Bacillota bacterium]
MTKLNQPVFKRLTTTEIQPEGWLKEQLKIQAEGLSGNLDKFWPDIKDSQWIGGDAEGWERVPYWLDGFIPLAWLLDDEDMKKRAQKYIDYIIENQADDGWLCPTEDEERSEYDVWAKFLILKVLVVYHNTTGDERIEEVVQKALQALDKHIDRNTLFSWGQTRWFECLLSIWWLYERIEEEWLLELASKIKSQGFDWEFLFKNHWPYKEPDEKGRWSQMSHVVNNAMMLKAGALLWRMTGEEKDLNIAEEMVELLDKYHGMVTGVFTGDECLAGTSPVQGTELCAVAEYMYSLEHLIAVTGKGRWGDRLEKIAYNALPATFSPDMWTHQYDQQVNQPQCSVQDNPVYNTNSGESNIFGLEPNYGCCTANLSQPWPKLALSTFMQSEKELAAVVYAPSSVSTEIDEAKVEVKIETDYPFRDEVNFTVKTDREKEFSLWLRIPEWAENPQLEIEGEEIIKINSENIKEGFFCLERSWESKTAFTLILPASFKLKARPHNLYAVTRGPLVYSLKIEEEWKRIHQDIPGREEPHADYEIYPLSDWNYGLCLNKENPDLDINYENRKPGKYIFSPEGSPVVAEVNAKKINWKIEDGVVSPFPEKEWIAEEKEKIELIPYGCTNIRMTEMPVLDE